MKEMNVAEKIKYVLEPKKAGIKARLFVGRDDGITIYDSIQNQTTASVSALVSGVWQASEALMGLVHPDQEVMEFRLAFDTSSQGVYLFPFKVSGKKYFLGAIYNNCLNPGQLKRQVTLIKEEMDRFFQDMKFEEKAIAKGAARDGFLFNDISDEEMDRLFSPGGF